MIAAMMAGSSITLACIVALLFLRAYRSTADRLFVYFAVAFVVLALQYVLTASLSSAVADPLAYVLRVAAFGTILAGVFDRNRR